MFLALHVAVYIYEIRCGWFCPTLLVHGLDEFLQKEVATGLVPAEPSPNDQVSKWEICGYIIRSI